MAKRRGRLHIDLGSVNEDAIWYRGDPNDLRRPPSERTIVTPNGKLDTEDQNNDGRLDQGTQGDEDVGLDRIQSGRSGDDPRDDYKFDDDVSETSPRKYAQVNGTEGNQEMDSEDLNDDSSLSTLSSYFTVSIDLGDSTLWETDVFRDYEGRNDLNFAIRSDNGWRRVRIPLDSDSLVRIESRPGIEPSWEKILHARVWVDSLADSTLLQIGGLEIIGNRWYEGPLANLADRPLPPEQIGPGEDFFVSVLNNKDDAAVYDPPFKPGKQNNVTEREQSITLELSNFAPAHKASIYRTYPTRQDYTLYENMEFYLRKRSELGDANLQATIRLCRDANSNTTNYYEYRIPILSDWYLVRMDFAEMSQLQLDVPDSVTKIASRSLPNGAVISRKGNPSLTSIQRIAFFVANRGQSTLGRGNVWINELRLTQVKKDRGYATRMSVQTNLSDVASFSGNLTRTNADFLSIGKERGSGTTTTAVNLASTVNVDRFLSPLGIRLPVRWSAARDRRVPKFQTNSDLVLDRATDRDISETNERRLEVSIEKESSENPWVRYGLAPFRLNGSHRKATSLTPTQRDTTTNATGGVSWAMALDNLAAFNLGKGWRAQLLPNSVSATLNGQRNRSRRYVRSDLAAPFRLAPTSNRNSAALNLGAGMRPLQFLNYRISSNRDLQLREGAPRLLGLNLGRETARQQDLSTNYDIPILKTSVAPKVTWSGRSGIDFLQYTNLQQDRQERTNSFRSGNSTSFSARLALGELAKLGRGGKGEKSGNSSAGSGPRGFKLEPMQLQYSLTHDNSRSSQRGTPSMLYQLGLSDNPGGDTRPVGLAQSTESEGKTFTLTTSLRMPQNVSVGTSANRTESNQRQNAQQPTTRVTTKWPDLNVNWGTAPKALVKVLGLESRVKSIQATTNFSRELQTTASQGRTRDTEQRSTAFSPLLNLNLTLNNEMTASLSSDSRVTRTQSYNPPPGNLNESISRKVLLTVKKTIRLTKTVVVPVTNQKKVVQTRLDLSGAIDWSQNKSTTSRFGAGQDVIGDDRSSLKVTTDANYQFTDNINGKASLSVGQNTDNKNEGNTTRLVSISVSAAFTF
ncbi:MAG: hypothetical protein IPK72_12970 [Candidatus Eisenbacteria bacterium]|nr:hypothetical protein [Candidatus Eisenbacteria bacterium]